MRRGADGEGPTRRCRVGLFIMDLPKKLPCGHDAKYYYFHPALRGGTRHRCAACDDPDCQTRFMQELKERQALQAAYMEKRNEGN